MKFTKNEKVIDLTVNARGEVTAYFNGSVDSDESVLAYDDVHALNLNNQPLSVKFDMILLMGYTQLSEGDGVPFKAMD